MPRFLIRKLNQAISRVVVAVTQYSTSVEARDNVVCFFLFHERGLESKKI